MAPILRKSQESFITKEAHDDKYYQQIIHSHEEVARSIEHKIPMQIEEDKEEEGGEEQDDDLVYQVDENGYLIDDQGQYILDDEGQFIKFDDQ